MRYAKLIGGSPAFAARVVCWRGYKVINPSPAKLIELGYKPVVFTDCPDAPEGFYWREIWSEEDGNILQGWVLKEETDASADEALYYLFGGDG